ncbi:MAG: hypothetical protein AB1439_12080 [candidate division FCPU426 bacterium]
MNRLAGMAAAGLTLGLAWAASAAAADGENAVWHFGGYYKTYLLAFQAGAGTAPEGEATGPFRLKGEWKPADQVAVTAAYELSPRITGGTAALASLPQPDAAAYRAADLAAGLYPAPGDPVANFVLTQNLDRASVALSFGFGDLTLGRQPVAFGSAKAVNPTDVLAPFTYQTIDKEERTGVDAVRFRTPLGEMGEADAGWVFGRDAKYKNSAWFVKPKVYILETDASLLLLKFRDHGLLGLDLARAVGGASVWLESAYVFDRLFAGRRAGADYFRLSAGADYNLADGWYGFVEYHYNGAGGSDPAGYPGLFARDAYTQGSVYLMGRQYLAPGLTVQITPLISGSAQVLWNLADASLLAAPGLTVSLADEVEGRIGGFISLGKNPESGQWLSEFGIYPDLLYASLNYYY